MEVHRGTTLPAPRHLVDFNVVSVVFSQVYSVVFKSRFSMFQLHYLTTCLKSILTLGLWFQICFVPWTISQTWHPQLDQWSFSVGFIESGAGRQPVHQGRSAAGAGTCVGRTTFEIFSRQNLLKSKVFVSGCLSKLIDVFGLIQRSSACPLVFPRKALESIPSWKALRS